VTCVCRGAISHDPGDGHSCALARVLERFDNENPGPLSYDETVAVAVEWPRHATRLVIEVGRQGPGSGKTAQADGIDTRLAPPQMAISASPERMSRAASPIA